MQSCCLMKVMQAAYEPSRCAGRLPLLASACSFSRASWNTLGSRVVDFPEMGSISSQSTSQLCESFKF